MKLLLFGFLFLFIAPKERAEYIIIWHQPQCKECVNEIGEQLNVLGASPQIGILTDNDPPISVLMKKREITGQLQFEHQNITSLPQDYFDEQKFPYLLKITQKDTVKLSYTMIFDNTGTLRKSQFKKWAK